MCSLARFRRVLLIASLFVLCLSAGKTQAAPGNLNTNFATGGKVTTDIANSDDVAQAMVVQPDGQIIIAGYAIVNHSYDFALARYATNGSLDTAFGNGGHITTDFFNGSDFGRAVALQSDGKIIVVGTASLANGNNNLALARYNADGTLDSSFGTGGRVATAALGSNSSAAAVMVLANGQIIVAGASNVGGAGSDFAVASFNSTGGLDSGFGTGGIAIVNIAGSGDYATGAALQSDGKIVVCGYTGGPATEDIAIARFNSNGSVDTTFGSAGIIVKDFAGGGDQAEGVAIQTDGKIVIAGHATNSSHTLDFALMRYQSNGTLDSSFGSGGSVITDFTGTNDVGEALTIQPNGRIVVAGISYNSGNYHSGLARYQTNGSLDSSFGINGKVTTNFSSISDSLYAVAVQPNGKIIGAGSYNNGGSSNPNDFLLASYNGDIKQRSDFDGDWRTNIAVWRQSDVNWIAINTATKV